MGRVRGASHRRARAGTAAGNPATAAQGEGVVVEAEGVVARDERTDLCALHEEAEPERAGDERGRERRRWAKKRRSVPRHSARASCRMERARA